MNQDQVQFVFEADIPDLLPVAAVVAAMARKQLLVEAAVVSGVSAAICGETWQGGQL